MPIVVFYEPESLTAAQYNEIVAELETKMKFPWDGLNNTMCFGTGNKLRVIDLWDSQEKFEKFCETLIPMIEKHGLKMAPPKIEEAYSSLEHGALRRYETANA